MNLSERDRRSQEHLVLSVTLQRVNDLEKALREYSMTFSVPGEIEDLAEVLQDARESLEEQKRNRSVKYQVIFTATRHHPGYDAGFISRGLTRYDDLKEAEREAKQQREYWINRGKLANNGVEGFEIWHVGLERIENAY